jgi:uncharacterized protein (DUF1800 family)
MGLASILALGMLLVGTAQAGVFEASSPQDVKLIKGKIRAAQFLAKATFGPTQADIDTLGARIAEIGFRRAASEWIDNQFAIPATSHRQKILDIFTTDGIDHRVENANVARVRHQAWWDIALQSDDQLRQKFSWALAQVFVISDQGQNFNFYGPDFSGDGFWLGPTVYYDSVLVENAFGSYRDLLSDMTFSPVMGRYLSHLMNRKADVPNQRFPDENYAREIMQLFSIGLYDLEQDGRLKRTLEGELIPSYDNEEIKTLARLFTGFKFENDNNNIYGPGNLNQPMEIWPAEHDNNLDYSEEGVAPANKRIFGTTLSPIPVNPTSEQVISEIEEGLDVLFEHDNTAPFISRLLIQRMVTSNPSRGYVRRVSRTFRDNGEGVRGDLKAVLKSILLDPEVFRGQRLLRKRNPLRVEVVSRGTEYTRLREPVLRIAAMIRALNPSSDYPDGHMMLGAYSIENDFGQAPYRSPSVFNFYLPDFQPPGPMIGFTPSRRNPNGALFSPEFQILTAVTANRSINRLQSWVRNRYIDQNFYTNNGYELRGRITFDLSAEEAMVADASGMSDLLRHFDLLLCNGSLTEETKDIIIAAVEANAESTSAYHTEVRLEESLLGVLLSADCAVEE